MTRSAVAKAGPKTRLYLRRGGPSGPPFVFAALSLWLCIVTVTNGQAVRSEVADAAQRGDRAAVQKLVQARANVNAPQVDGATALMWAVYRAVSYTHLTLPTKA